MRRIRVLGAIIGAALAVASFGWIAAPAMAVNSVTQISSYNDFRGDMANKPGTLWRATYGPYNIPAASGGNPGAITNAFFTVPAPCTGCRIVDMVPDLIFASGSNPGAIDATANLQDGVFLHHFVLAQPGVNDQVCPSNVIAQFAGQPEDRFGGAGNERTHVHLPGNYGYTNNAANWLENIHLQNLLPVPQNVYVQVIFRTRSLSATQPATPLWFDIDGCGPSGIPGDGPIPGDSEYPTPPGYNDQQRSWTSTVSGRVVAIGGHFHDIDYAQAGCTTHCAPGGGGYAVTAEINPAIPNTAVYYGPNPPTYPPTSVFPPQGGTPTVPTNLTGATLCRTEPGYNSSSPAAPPFSGTINSVMRANGHLDTISMCGTEVDKPVGAQPEAYPAGGKYPGTGFQLNSGDIVKLHSQYYNGLGFTKPDAMGIMNAWLVPSTSTPSGPLRVPLVPSFRQCGTGGNPSTESHASPLSVGSCPPAVTASSAHVGVQSLGVAGYEPLADNPATGGDEADMAIGARVTDVRATGPTGADYDPIVGPDLRLWVRIRLTDSNNGASGTDRATTTDFDYGVPLDCALTSDGGIGSTCSVDTTIDTISPGTIIGAKQTVAQIFRVRLNDPGPNNILGDGDDRLFEQGGLFTP